MVGREFNVGKDDNLYAATPPLEALRYVLSYAGTWGDGSSERRAVMINDVRRAYFYARATRVLYVELPREDPEYGQSDKVGRLRLCLYGTRDSALNWQETLSEHLLTLGFKRGVGFPSVFVNSELDIWTLAHGDDCCSAGRPEAPAWLELRLAEKYEIKTQRIGHRPKCSANGQIV